MGRSTYTVGASARSRDKEQGAGEGGMMTMNTCICKYELPLPSPPSLRIPACTLQRDQQDKALAMTNTECREATFPVLSCAGTRSFISNLTLGCPHQPQIPASRPFSLYPGAGLVSTYSQATSPSTHSVYRNTLL